MSIHKNIKIKIDLLHVNMNHAYFPYGEIDDIL